MWPEMMYTHDDDNATAQLHNMICLPGQISQKGPSICSKIKSEHSAITRDKRVAVFKVGLIL